MSAFFVGLLVAKMESLRGEKSHRWNTKFINSDWMTVLKRVRVGSVDCARVCARTHEWIFIYLYKIHSYIYKCVCVYICEWMNEVQFIPVYEDPWVCAPWRLHKPSSLLPVTVFPIDLWSNPTVGIEYTHYRLISEICLSLNSHKAGTMDL